MEQGHESVIAFKAVFSLYVSSARASSASDCLAAVYITSDPIGTLS